jgi:hypothetical protein
MNRIAAEYGVCLSIQRVKDTLVKDGTCARSGKKVLKRNRASIQVHCNRCYRKSDKPP